MKQKLTIWFLENQTLIEDLVTFSLVVIMGVFSKIYREIQKGKSPNWKWFIAEAILSFFVAISVWAVFDQFLEMNKIFTYVICAWAGSLSTIFHNKAEMLVGKLFDSIALWFNQKLGVQNEKSNQ